MSDQDQAARRAAVAERKRLSRERLKQFDIKVVEVKLSARERKILENSCKVRGGVAGPYGADEYISTLIRRDHERLNRQLAELGKCEHCKTALPAGCGGTFKGDGRCFHSRQSRDLLL